MLVMVSESAFAAATCHTCGWLLDRSLTICMRLSVALLHPDIGECLYAQCQQEP